MFARWSLFVSASAWDEPRFPARLAPGRPRPVRLARAHISPFCTNVRKCTTRMQQTRTSVRKARISARMDQTCRRTATISVRLHHSCRYVRSQARPRGPAQETPASHKSRPDTRSIRAASQDVGEGPRAEARRSARRSWPHPCDLVAAAPERDATRLVGVGDVATHAPHPHEVLVARVQRHRERSRARSAPRSSTSFTPGGGGKRRAGVLERDRLVKLERDAFGVGAKHRHAYARAVHAQLGRCIILRPSFCIFILRTCSRRTSRSRFGG